MNKHAPQSPEQQRLADALRGLRADAKLSTTKLAALLGERWSQSRVSRIERGVTRPTPDDVDEWVRAVNQARAAAEKPTEPVDPDIRRDLMSLAEHGRIELTEWRRALAPGRVRKQQEVADLERRASVIRVFSADTIPGLAQTAAYAERMYALGIPDLADEPDDLDAAVAARMARQSVLDSDKQIRLLMSEFALRRHLVTGEQQREQIGRLVGLLPRPNVRLGVIPFAAREVVHQYQAYAILGDPDVDAGALVLAEMPTRELTIRGDEVAGYVEHYEQLDSTALHGDELAEFLGEVAAHVTWP